MSLLSDANVTIRGAAASDNAGDSVAGAGMSTAMGART